MEASTQFEQALGGGDHESLRGLCESKAASLPGEEGETWAFLRIHFDPDPRRWVPALQCFCALNACFGAQA